MKKVILIFFSILYSIVYPQQIIKSPDGSISLKINFEKELNFEIDLNGNPLISKSNINLLFNKQSVIKKLSNPEIVKDYVNEKIEVPISYKQKVINDEYNLLILKFSNAMVEFRVYDDGIAYRFNTSEDKEVKVNEVASYNFAGDYKMWSSLIPEFTSSYEVPYSIHDISSFPADSNSYLPILFSDTAGNKILLTDADVYNYPNMFLKKSKDNNTLDAIFPPFPLDTELLGDRQSKILKGADYIAKSNGKRTFPWRVFIIAEEDRELIESDMIYKLSRSDENNNYSWIKPGRVAWDWWNALNLYDVNFEAGLNTETWKYYLDFASDYGLEYIILDEGWSISTTDITKPNLNLNLEELIRHGKSKNVDIILWTTWRALNDNWQILDKYQEWGIGGIKIDFMDRADQWMVEYYEKAAKEAFDRKLIVDFHGAYKPTGLRRKYPNIVSYEGVLGLENTKWSKRNTPSATATIPFIRMVCGPMDYTPGAMRNYHSNEYTPSWSRPGSMGTRAHQVALFILFESGIQMLADSPSNYRKEKETTEFLSKIPVVWDEIIVLDGEIGKHLTIARKNKDDWFIGGITADNERELDIKLSFLDKGTYKAHIMVDGVNADNFAEDYKVSEKKVNSETTLKINMVKEGGFAVIIKKNE